MTARVRRARCGHARCASARHVRLRTQQRRALLRRGPSHARSSAAKTAAQIPADRRLAILELGRRLDSGPGNGPERAHELRDLAPRREETDLRLCAVGAVEDQDRLGIAPWYVAAIGTPAPGTVVGHSQALPAEHPPHHSQAKRPADPGAGLWSGPVDPPGRGGAATRGDDASMSRRMGILAALTLVVAALAMPASGGAARATAAAHSLHVDLTEWALVPSGGLVASGSVRLTVQNHGLLLHELDIIPTSFWGDVPDVRNGRADVAGVARPVIVKPGQTRSARVSLAPGSYLLLDNIRGHYQLGNAVPIVVR